MSRRDTIIIAVLVNAGLLMVLFATAMRSGKTEESAGQASVQLANTSPLENKVLEEELLIPVIQTIPSLDLAQEELVFSSTSPLNVPVPILETPTPPVAAAPAKPSPPKEPRFVNVTVKKGDFLEKIAKANQTTVAAIMQANHLSSTQLKIGQVLKIPASPLASEAVLVQNGEDFYVVKEGDSPWLIASRNHLKLEDLLRLNGLDEQKARRLRPGDRLRIR